MEKNEINSTINPKTEFEINPKLILDFLKKHYDVPEFLTGFTLTADVDCAITVEWRTYLTKKAEATNA
jgi:hypothetical protein